MRSLCVPIVLVAGWFPANWARSIPRRMTAGCQVGLVVLGGMLLALPLTAAESKIKQPGIPALAEPVLTQGNGKFMVVEPDGQVSWELAWGPIHDLHLVGDQLYVQEGPAAVARIDMGTKKVVWRYDSAKLNGNEGKPVEVHSFFPLGNDQLMIAESGPARILEVGVNHEIQRQFPLRVEHPHPHTDTRLVRRGTGNNYLVCHEADGVVREYSPDGKVVWEYKVPLFGKEPAPGHGPESFGNKVFGAWRLESGNTLLTTGNGHSVLEVTPSGEIVWKVEQRDLPGITLAWVTTLQILPNGHYVIGNCHAGPDQPQLIEIDPKTKGVVSIFQRFELVGNDMSNSLVLVDAKQK